MQRLESVPDIEIVSTIVVACMHCSFVSILAGRPKEAE